MNAAPHANPGGWAASAVAWALPILAAVALASVFWWPLLEGGGFIGGDTYNYFFPLKDHYAAGLRSGELFFWHAGIGNGVPVLGESQTAALYPPNIAAYSLLSLNSAYNAVFLAHYLLAFLFTYVLVRSLGVGLLGSLLGALAFVYGWFPPRACLEWAIVTGAWMPAVIYGSLRYLDTGRLRWFAFTAGALSLQLLGGHFHLAWVTIVAVGIIGLVWPVAGAAGSVVARKGLLIVALVAAFGLTAVQLAPTWELKVRSERQEDAFRSQIEEGLVPWRYLPQAVAPWTYYMDPDSVLREMGAKTNKVEAHLYFGLLPLALAVLGLVSGLTWRQGWPWLVLASVSLLLATGAIVPWLADVPGFRFFRYCGRYGLATQLSVAILAAMALDRFLLDSRGWRLVVAVIVLVVTAGDLYLVGQRVQYVVVTNPPVLLLREQSEVFQQLSRTDRVLAMDPNTLSLSGAACVPPYLGLSPAVYSERWRALPDVFHGEVGDAAATKALLQRAGVTHILTFEPLPREFPATLLWRGVDSFLHPRWARDVREPLYLYRFDATMGRAFALSEDGAPMANANVVISRFHPHEVVLDVELPETGAVVLTDLVFPGWTVTIDGVEVESKISELSRVVAVDAGSHEIVWKYWPQSVVMGLAISLGTFVFGSLLLYLYRSSW